MKVMLIGASAAGKTTLIQRLIDKELKYDKTQVVEYVGDFIDTPGEYMQQRGYWGSLTIVSHDADVIGMVQDAASDECWFSPGTATKFSKPVIGIITKMDLPGAKPAQARSYLELAGCHKIYELSSFTGDGVDEMFLDLHRMLDQYNAQNAYRFSDDYFD